MRYNGPLSSLWKRSRIMAPHLLFYQLLLVALVLVCVMMHVWWPDAPRAIPQTPGKLAPPRRKRSQAPKPFPGCIHPPLCEACEQGAQARSTAPGFPPPLIRFTRGRRRTVTTQLHCCLRGVAPLPHHAAMEDHAVVAHGRSHGTIAPSCLVRRCPHGGPLFASPRWSLHAG
jgi:hypothetical protein